jgi:hypothetical protein
MPFPTSLSTVTALEPVTPTLIIVSKKLVTGTGTTAGIIFYTTRAKNIYPAFVLIVESMEDV